MELPKTARNKRRETAEYAAQQSRNQKGSQLEPQRREERREKTPSKNSALFASLRLKSRSEVLATSSPPASKFGYSHAEHAEEPPLSAYSAVIHSLSNLAFSRSA
jgi:hypothetical protein